MRNYAVKGIVSETLLAVSVNAGEPPLPQMVCEVTASFPLDALLRKIGTVSCSLANAEDRAIDGPAFWLDLAEDFCGTDSLPPKLVKWLESGEVRLTSTTQLANMALFAVYNRNCSRKREASFLRLLGMYNLCERRKPDSDTYYIDPDSVEAGFAVTTSHHDRFINVANRYLEFIEWSDAEGSGKSSADVRSLVESATRLSFEDYLRCVTALHSYFDPPDAQTNGISPINRQLIRADTPLLTWLDDRSYLPEDIDAILGETPFSTLRDRGHFLVLERPFVRLGDLYYLLNPRSLDNALGLGIFYAGMKASVARAGSNKKARIDAAKTFGGVAGKYFEQYAGLRVRRVAEKAGSYFHGEVRDDEGNMSSDFFVLEGECLVFFEMRHGRVARDVIENLDPKGIEDAFESVLYVKLKQLDRSLHKFAYGGLIVPGIEREKVKTLYPVVCLPSSFPRSHAIQRKMDKDIEKRGWFPPSIQGFEVAPFEIIEADSLEGLDGIGNAFQFSDLIAQKTGDPLTRFTFFKNFLANTKRMKLQMDRPEQQKRSEMLNRYRDDTVGWISR